MVIKLSMYVGLHDVYPAMDVNLACKREVKMTAACNFISLGEEIGELLDKNGKRKKKKRKRGKLLITWLDKKRREIRTSKMGHSRTHFVEFLLRNIEQKKTDKVAKKKRTRPIYPQYGHQGSSMTSIYYTFILLNITFSVQQASKILPLNISFLLHFKKLIIKHPTNCFGEKAVWKALRPVYTEHDHDHERQRGVRIGLRISNLYESVYTKGDHKRGWKLARAESRRSCLQSEFLGDSRLNYFLSTNQFFFRVTRPRWHTVREKKLTN